MNNYIILSHIVLFVVTIAVSGQELTKKFYSSSKEKWLEWVDRPQTKPLEINVSVNWTENSRLRQQMLSELLPPRPDTLVVESVSWSPDEAKFIVFQRWGTKASGVALFYLDGNDRFTKASFDPPEIPRESGLVGIDDFTYCRWIDNRQLSIVAWQSLSKDPSSTLENTTFWWYSYEIILSDSVGGHVTLGSLRTSGPFTLEEHQAKLKEQILFR